MIHRCSLTAMKICYSQLIALEQRFAVVSHLGDSHCSFICSSKGYWLPRNPQEASQWYITIQKQLNRGCSQIQSKWQTLLQRVWQLCWTGDRTIHLSCNGNAVQLSSWRRPRNWVRACTEGPWSWLGLQASFFQCWLLSRDSCLLPSLRCAEEGDRRARHERQVTGQLVSSSGPYNWPALTEVL